MAVSPREFAARAFEARDFQVDEQSEAQPASLSVSGSSPSVGHLSASGLNALESQAAFQAVTPKKLIRRKPKSRYYKIAAVSQVVKGSQVAKERSPQRYLPVIRRNESRAIAFHASKRCADIIGSGILLTSLLPVLAGVAVGVKLTSAGPVIFRQTRMTKNGRVFSMYKFRSMVSDAERASGAVWAAKNDPRVTKFGTFIRKTRLDELPQLFNVLSGDMSLIGPRPERPEFVEKLSAELPSFKKRLQVKAGLTGLAQVASGYAASVDSYREKLVWDLVYVKKQSWTLEAKIALRTIWVVVSGFGAR